MANAKNFVQGFVLLFFVVSVQIQAHSVTMVVVLSTYLWVECHIIVFMVKHLFSKRVSEVWQSWHISTPAAIIHAPGIPTLNFCCLWLNRCSSLGHLLDGG